MIKDYFYNFRKTSEVPLFHDICCKLFCLAGVSREAVNKKTDHEQPGGPRHDLFCLPDKLSVFYFRGRNLVVEGFDHVQIEFSDRFRHGSQVEKGNDCRDAGKEKQEHDNG